MKIRYLAFLTFILIPTLASMPTAQRHDEPQYFYRYVGKTPVIWKPGLPICLDFSNPTVQLSAIYKSNLFIEFKKLSTLVVNEGCKQANIKIDFGVRENLSYLNGNLALAAAIPTYDSQDPRFIVGGHIQVDSETFKKLDERTRINLLLHEMGHVLGFAHTDDGSLMVPVISGVNESKYPRVGIRYLISRERLPK